MSLISRIVTAYFKLAFCLFCSWVVVFILGGLIKYAIIGPNHQMISSYSMYGIYFMLIFISGFSLLASVVLTVPTVIWNLSYKSYLAYGITFLLIFIAFSIIQGSRELDNYGFYSYDFFVEELLVKLGLSFALYVVFMLVYRLFFSLSNKYNQPKDVLDADL